MALAQRANAPPENRHPVERSFVKENPAASAPRQRADGS